MKEFAPFRLDTVNQCLWRCREAQGDERILLTPKAFDVLQYLVDRAGRLVTQAELLDALWPDTHVQPEVLKSQILDVRNALGDRPKSPHFIETLPRRGYRFIAAVVDGAIAPPVAPPRMAGKLVGRDQTIRELRNSLAVVMQRECCVLFLSGEPGIGKTSLADEFLLQVGAITPRIRTARGQCVEGYGGKEAYYPMLQALGSLCGGADGAELVQVLEAEAPTWLVQFPALLKRAHRQTLQREILGATRERMLREICDAIGPITALNPLVLVLEDLQWVDPATVDLISALARCREPARLMLIGTHRPAETAMSNHPLHAVKRDLLAHHLCREIELKPLGEIDIAEYLTTGSPATSLPAGLTGLLYRHSEGNPLFMVAALDHLTERGLISQEAAGWRLLVPLEQIELDVPESLRQMIEAQIEVLSPLQQRVLEAASIPDATIASCVSAAAADVSPESFEEQCETLSQRNRVLCRARPLSSTAISDCQQYEFVHALYREVCYRRQPAGQRAKLHRRTGLRMEELFPERLSDLAPELAHHFEAGADWARAVRYLRMVAETARNRYAHREAAALLVHALELLARLPEAERAVTEIEILQKLAATYAVLFDPRCIETYETLAASAARNGLIDAEIGALVDVALPLASISLQRYLEVLDRALRLSCGQSDPVMRAKTRATCLVRRMAAAGWNPRDAGECRHSLESIRQSGNRSLIGSYLIDYSFVQSMSSEYRDAYRSAAESLAILSGGGDENPYLSVAHWLSHRSLLFLGHWGDALDAIDAAIARVEKNGDMHRIHTLRLYQAWVHLNALDFTGALAICESVRPTLPQIRSASGIRHCLVVTGSAEASLGRYKDAAEHLLEARDGMDREVLLFDWYWRLPIESALTELWLAQRSLAEARQQADRFLRATLSTAERTWQALAWDASARVAVAENDAGRALSCIDEAISTLEGYEAPLAAWRVFATAAELEERHGNRTAAEHHRQSSRTTIRKLADSLPPGSAVREVFLSSPLIRGIVG